MTQPTFKRKYHLVNLVTNGSFENDFTGWSNIRPTQTVSTERAVTGTKSCRFNGDIPSYSWSNNYLGAPRTGHIYYQSIWCINDVATGWGLYAGENGNMTENVSVSHDVAIHGTAFRRLSRRTKVNSTKPQLNLLIYGAGSTAATGTSFWDDALVIDLTSTFGKGAEPTIEWCDEHISYFDGDMYLEIEDTALDTITDRTAADAAYARQVQSTTATDLKGAYNVSDFNRIEKNCRYLAAYLSYQGYLCTIDTKIDWTMNDIPYLYEHMNRIRENTIKIINCFLQFENRANVPEISLKKVHDYKQANNLEKCYQLTINFLDAMMHQLPICGVHSCGELY